MKKLTLDELGRMSVDEFREAQKDPGLYRLDNIRSLHNVGSAFRTADAFRIEKVFLTGITGTPPHRRFKKTALGATESVTWEYAEQPIDVVRKLKAQGYKIAVIEQTDESVPLHTFNISTSDSYCLVFGNEINGVSEEVVEEGDLALEIPQVGTKHSLNVSVCLGIVVWELFKKLTILPH